MYLLKYKVFTSPGRSLSGDRYPTDRRTGGMTNWIPVNSSRSWVQENENVVDIMGSEGWPDATAR